MMGAHSMMERPDPVRRVAPPRMTMPQIMKETVKSQMATRLRFRLEIAASADGKVRSSNGIFQV